MNRLHRERQHADLIQQALLTVQERSTRLQNAIDWSRGPHKLAKKFLDDRLNYPDIAPPPSADKPSNHTGRSSLALKVQKFFASASHSRRQISQAIGDAPEVLSTQFESYIVLVKLALEDLEKANLLILKAHEAMCGQELLLASMRSNRAILSTLPASSRIEPTFDSMLEPQPQPQQRDRGHSLQGIASGHGRYKSSRRSRLPCSSD
jgi:hypothetical protein